MSKKEDSETGPADVETVKKWLGKVGYPLEMGVAQRLQAAGFKVTQAEYYRDMDGETHREIDVVGRLDVLLGGQGGIDAAFELLALVECKAIPNIVVFTTTNAATGPGLTGVDTTARIGTSAGELLLAQLRVKQFTLLKPRKRYGYAAKRLYEGKNQDVAYETIRDVVAASIAQCEFDDVDGVDAIRACRIVFPTIVVSPPLFECYLDSNGDPQVKEVERVPLAWRHPTIGQPLVIVEMMTPGAVPYYAQVLREFWDTVLGHYHDEIEQACRLPPRNEKKR